MLAVSYFTFLTWGDGVFTYYPAITAHSRPLSSAILPKHFRCCCVCVSLRVV